MPAAQPLPARARVARADAARAERDAAILTAAQADPGWLSAVLGRLQPDPAGCLLWSGPIARDGYSVAQLPPGSLPGNRSVRVHRLALVLSLGRPLGPGMHAGHTCHDSAHAAGQCSGGRSCSHRRCANAAHLAEQTARANALAGAGLAARNAAVTACPAGHPLTAGNLTRASWARGGRECLACNRARARTAYAAARALGLTPEQYRAGRAAAAAAAAQGHPTLWGPA